MKVDISSSLAKKIINILDENYEKIDAILEEINKSGQNRFKSKVLWVSIVSLLLMILGHLGIYEKIGIDKTVFQGIFDLIFLVLGGFGIFNNPTDKQNF